jgi:hypothetical protein
VWTLEEEEKRLARKLKAEGVRKEQEALLRSLQETRKADAARIRSQVRPPLLDYRRPL